MPTAQVNGIELFYHVQGQGEPVLLLPGFTADHTVWAGLVPKLAAEYMCITPDNRGCGRSSQPDGPYTTRQMADDAVALLDHLGIGQCHVVGGSMGGTIAQEIALAYPERVKSLAILCSWARPDTKMLHLLDLWKQIWANLSPVSYAEFLFQFGLTHRFYAAPGAIDMALSQWAANPFPPTPAGFAGQAEACRTHDALDRLEQIKAPTLVWAGAEDILLPVSFSREIAERIPKARYYEMPEVGHAFMLEQPEATAIKLLDWLKKAKD